MKKGEFLPGKGRRRRSAMAGILLRSDWGEDAAWFPGRDPGPALLGISLVGPRFWDLSAGGPLCCLSNVGEEVGLWGWEHGCWEWASG